MPVLLVDIEAIGRNSETVARMLRAHGLDLVGVTKGCLGEPRVGAAMIAAGAVALADTRDANLRRLRASLPGVELHRIQLPPLGQDFEAGDVTYVSSVAGVSAVAGLRCTGSSRAREVMLQLETGDVREGVPLELLEDVALAVIAEPKLQLAGISTNYACFHGAPESIRQSVSTVALAAVGLRAAGIDVPRVSGGNSSLLALLARGETLPPEVTELRCGEALLLGHDALFYRELAGCVPNACILRAEVLEEYTKPIRSGGPRRLVLGIGRQDLGSGPVGFLDTGLLELGRSADYLVAEQAGGPRVRIGDMIDMIPSYEALVSAWTSPFVERRFSG